MANAATRKEKPSAYPSHSAVTSIVGAQIRALVNSLNKKNFKATAEELRSVRNFLVNITLTCQLLALHGQDTYTYLLRILLESVDLKADPESKQQKENLKLQLLSQEVGAITDKPYFPSVILRALEGLEMPPHDEAVARFSRLLRLSLQQEVALALCFASSIDPKIQAEASKYIKGRLPSDLTLAQNVLPEPMLHNLLYFLRTHDGLAKQEANVLRGLQKFYPHSDLSYHDGAAVFNAKLDTKPQDTANLIARVASHCKAADLLEDVGYSATSSIAILQEMLQQFAPIKETDAAAIIAMMIRTHTGLEDAPPLQRYGNAASWEAAEAGTTWNVTVLVDTLKEMSPKLNWSLITRNLDQPSFFVPDQKGLDMLMNALRRGSKEGVQVGVLVDGWSNTKGQLSLLRLALENSDFDWSALRQPTDLSAVPVQWQSPQLVRALLRLAEVENYGIVRTIFERPMRSFPDALLVTLAKVKRPAWTPLYAELVSPLLASALQSNSSALPQIWAANRALVVRGFVELYHRDRTQLARVADVAQELKALPTLLDARPFAFALELAALSAQHDTQFFEKWLSDKFSEHESVFARAVAVFLKEKTAAGTLSAELLTSFLRVLQAKFSLVPQDLVEDLRQLFAAVQQNPQIAAANATEPPKEGEAATGQTKFPADIEDEANKRFRQIYRGDLTMVQAIQMLKALKESKAQRDELIFLCMIHNLFDEYRYFPKFPEKELQITAVLFGSLIQHQLISYIPLGMALRYVLEALRKAPPSNMFTFGITALEQFRIRLTEWPQYCSHLLQIAHLRQARPDIADFIEKTVRAQQGSPAGAGPQPPLGTPAERGVGVAPGVGAAAAAAPPALAPTTTAAPKSDAPSNKDAVMPNYDKLSTLTQTTPTKPLIEPPETVQDKIYFIINNLSQMNLEQKVVELRGLIRPEWTAWVANYLVVKRVSMEANFHPLYLAFIDRLCMPELMKEVLLSTVSNVRLLIASDKIKDVSSERALLKHLGSWLGNITIGRNRPLLHRDLYLKGLVLEAFKQGKLSAVVPFLCKILECCKTKLFSYPNVWVTAHLRLLIEIYQIPNLKLNVKIEIELLFNNLGVDMKELKATTFLKDSLSRSSAAPGAELASQGNAGAPGQPASPHLSGIPQEIVTVAIDRAIKEIITPVVERSGSIACVTTRELILKDFAAEPDESKVRKAAHHMVQSLASSLAMVTCKEPLRVSISNHLRSLLQPSLPQSEQHEVALENSVQAVCADNLDVACAVIEKAAREKAVRDIDEAVGLAFAYTARKKHRESGAQRPFYDMAFVSPRYPATLPENLRPKAGEPYQLRVYEDFSRIARMAAAAANGKEGGPANSPSLDASSPVASPPLVGSSGLTGSATGGSGASLSGIGAAALAKKGAGLLEQVKAFFEEWLQICNDNALSNEKVLSTYVGNLLSLLRAEETQANIFRLFADICIEYHDRANTAVQQLTYHTIDLYSKLVVLLVKSISDPNYKFTMLSSAFTGVVGVLLSDFELKKGKFDQRPYHRLFTNWLQDLMSDSANHPVNLSIQAFSAAFVRLSPSVVPGFAFAWVELIFSRLFMPKLLLSKSQKGWPMFKRLLVELLRFLEPYLRNAELTEPIRLLYKGTLKALLVLLHDFPEFLCDYHYSFCDAIPPSCIQLRNIILSAFPRHMHLPDPFTPNLKVDRLPEINQAPHILSDFSSAVARTTFKAEIDNFLKTRSPTFFRELKLRVLLPAAEQVAAGTKYNVPVLNSLVMYVGAQAISLTKAAKGPAPIIRSAPMEIFQHLATELDTEGRYLFLNSVANQLRYPNTHTHYFSCVLLYLFAEARQEIVKEQITRVLLERLIVNRPHPWGLLITFLEIIKNPRYDFWKNSFTRCDPEIKRLFESVSRTCMGKNKVSDQVTDEHHDSQ